MIQTSSDIPWDIRGHEYREAGTELLGKLGDFHTSLFILHYKKKQEDVELRNKS